MASGHHGVAPVLDLRGQGCKDPGMGSKTEVDWLEEIRSCSTLAADSERMTTRAVVNARKLGIPWAAIGEALGISRQLATYRYEKHCG
jgi:hypothetical protein